MDYKNINKKIVSILLVTSFIGGSYLPIFTPKAQAFLGVGDFGVTVDVQALIRSIVDGIAMNLAQRLVDQTVQATVNWANSGFEDKPAFVTDTKQYFTSIADSAAGQYIEGTRLAGVCSPFQANLRISLAKYYTDTYRTSYNNSQCTLTGVVKNIDKFYNNFSEGGWGGFISMTQDDNNNPLGAFIKGKIELDKGISEAVKVKEDDLTKGLGFKSKADCLEYNEVITMGGGKASTTPQYDSKGIIKQGVNTFNSNSVKVLKDPTLPEGACIRESEIKTPGSVIKTQLDKVLPSGLDKLISVEHVEQLISAFSGGLLQRFVFGPKGLIGKDHQDTYSKTKTVGSASSPKISCFADTDLATMGETPVTWTIQGLPANYKDILWTGSEVDNASSTSLNIVYQTPSEYGKPKTATVRITTEGEKLNPLDETGPIKTYGPIRCEGAVQVSRYQPLSVSCYPSIPTIKYKTPVSWIASISGGSGKFKLIQWGGQQESVPKTNIKMLPVNGQNPNVPLIEYNYPLSGSGFGSLLIKPFILSPVGIVQIAAIYKTLNSRAAEGLTTQELILDEDGIFTSILTRVYLRDKDPIDTVNAWITVVDSDPTVPAVSKVTCKGEIHIDPTDN